jgi:predicted ATPase/DNA-binding SARP family transcriptional activator
LILNAGTSFRREKLAGQLWPESTEDSARDYLRHALWRIRKALQEASSATYLKSDDLTIAFDASTAYWLDVAGVREVSEKAPAEELIEALSSYSGELLPGFYDEWVVLERQHLQGIYERKVERLLESLQEAGRWEQVLEWGEKWIALGQKPEAAYRYLMSAHAAKGDLSKVATTYERCVKSMRDFDLEPSEQTRLLFSDLRAGRGAPAVAAGSGRELGSRRTRPGRLPAPLTSFVGRTKELKEVASLISASRLVTLAGSGGVGKTRLAVQSAQHAKSNFKDGVFWVDLVGLVDGELIPQQIAQSLDLQEQPHEPIMVSVKNYLTSRETLLVIDNCEHLVEASARNVEQLLTACPKIRILTTSRERLGLFSEVVWFVPSLSEGTSLQLFAERARSARHDFALNESNRSSVEQICQRIDRMPLAIELAAARVAMLSVAEIAQHLDDRFALLTTGSRTALSHQQTLRGTIDWSHELLTPPERILFRRLALFSGGFTLAALESVCKVDGQEPGSIVDLLGKLVDKSLVIPDPSEQGAETRYHMLESIRQFADEKLRESGEMDAFRDRHLDCFLGLAEEAEMELRGPRQTDWFNRLEPELENLRTAMVWSMGKQPGSPEYAAAPRLEKGLRLAGALNNFWERNHRREALALIEGMLSHASFSSIGCAKALVSMGMLHWASSEHEQARPHLERASRMARELKDQRVLAWSESHLGAALVALGEYDDARPHLEEVRGITQSLPVQGSLILGWTLAFLGDIPFAQGDPQAAKELYEESARLAKETHDINTLTYCSRRLGYLALQQSQYAMAEQCFTESLQYNEEISHDQGINRCVAAFACLRAAQGRSEQAAQLCGAVESYLASVSASLFHWDEEFFKLNLSRLREKLPEARFQKLWMKGQKMSLAEAVALAFSQG